MLNAATAMIKEREAHPRKLRTDDRSFKGVTEMKPYFKLNSVSWQSHERSFLRYRSTST